MFCTLPEIEREREGKVGDWRNHFTEEQSARLDALIAERIPSDCGLVFDFGDE